MSDEYESARIAATKILYLWKAYVCRNIVHNIIYIYNVYYTYINILATKALKLHINIYIYL